MKKQILFVGIYTLFMVAMIRNFLPL